MLKGTWFLFGLLVVILASSMIFGSYGAIEGYTPAAVDSGKKKCSGATCSGN